MKFLPVKNNSIAAWNPKKLSIYESCLSLGLATGVLIAKLSRVSRKETYRYLEELIAVGRIWEFPQHGRPKIYATVDPESGSADWGDREPKIWLQKAKRTAKEIKKTIGKKNNFVYHIVTSKGENLESLAHRNRHPDVMIGLCDGEAYWKKNLKDWNNPRHSWERLSVPTIFILPVKKVRSREVRGFLTHYYIPSAKFPVKGEITIEGNSILFGPRPNLVNKLYIKAVDIDDAVLAQMFDSMFKLILKGIK